MIGTVLLTLLALAVLAALAVFLRIGFTMKVQGYEPVGHRGHGTKRPPPPPTSTALIPPTATRDEVDQLIEYGLGQSELGLCWAVLSHCDGLKLGTEWGEGVLAGKVRAVLDAKDREIEQLKKCINELDSRAGGGAADTAQRAGPHREG